MSRTIDLKKINKVRRVLARRPEGLWIRELARQTKMPVSTLHYHLYKHLKAEVKIRNIYLSGVSNQYKVVRLKKK